MKIKNFFKNSTPTDEGVDLHYAYMRGLNIIDSTDNLLQHKSCVNYIELFEKITGENFIKAPVKKINERINTNIKNYFNRI